VLGGQLRIEARLPVPRDLERQLAAVGDHRLPAIAVAAVALATFSGQVVVHLGVQRPLGERLLQLVQQAALLEG